MVFVVKLYMAVGIIVHQFIKIQKVSMLFIMTLKSKLNIKNILKDRNIQVAKLSILIKKNIENLKK